MVGAALEAHFYKRLTTTGFPVPLVEINNAMLMINGGMTLLKEASNSGYIVQQPLCDPTYLFGIHNSNHMRRIAKILTALRQTIIEIKVLAAKEASGISCQQNNLSIWSYPHSYECWASQLFHMAYLLSLGLYQSSLQHQSQILKGALPSAAVRTY